MGIENNEKEIKLHFSVTIIKNIDFLAHLKGYKKIEDFCEDEIKEDVEFYLNEIKDILK